MGYILLVANLKKGPGVGGGRGGGVSSCNFYIFLYDTFVINKFILSLFFLNTTLST